MIIWIGIDVVVAIVVLYLVGIALPKSYKPAVETPLEQPPEVVWPVISGVEAIVDANFPNRTAQRLPDENGLPVWLVDLGQNQMTIQTIESTPPERLVRVVANSATPLTSTYLYELTAVPPGSHLRINAEIYLDSGNWRIPFLRLSIRLFGRAGLKGLLSSIVSHLGT
ncbi:MAG: hypothetical protein KC419_13815 [Anaerolineales bacterium]|nr:hypothetical protein [Anaerolineales bacterium]